MSKLNIIKFLSCLGMLASSAWFFIQPDFAAVLVGILSLFTFMFTFLLIDADAQI